jgi:hypothetical protein
MQTKTDNNRLSNQKLHILLQTANQLSAVVDLRIVTYLQFRMPDVANRQQNYSTMRPHYYTGYSSAPVTRVSSSVRPPYVRRPAAQLRRHRVIQIQHGKKLLSLEPVVRTRRSYERVGLIKRQKSFQGLAVYSHELSVDVLTNESKVLGDTFYYVSHSVSD